jgi:hypothetical protein
MVVDELVKVAICLVEVGVGSDQRPLGVFWAGRVDPGLWRRCLMCAPWDAEALNRRSTVSAHTLLHFVSVSAAHSDPEFSDQHSRMHHAVCANPRFPSFHCQRLRTVSPR